MVGEKGQCFSGIMHQFPFRVFSVVFGTLQKAGHAAPVLISEHYFQHPVAINLGLMCQCLRHAVQCSLITAGRVWQPVLVPWDREARGSCSSRPWASRALLADPWSSCEMGSCVQEDKYPQKVGNCLFLSQQGREWLVNRGKDV